MNEASTLPEFLTGEQVALLAELLGNVEFLPISILFCRGDEHRVIGKNRVIPDDFIYIPVKGALDCRVGGEKRLIEPGAFMMVPAGTAHDATMAAGICDYAVYALHMHIYDETRHRLFDKMSSYWGQLGDLQGWTTRLATCTCLMGQNPEMGGLYMRKLVVELLVEQFLLGQTMRSLPAKTDQRITRLLGLIRQSPTETWTVTGMARECNLSVSRFRQLFDLVVGTSPKKYVQNVRLSLARSMLATLPDLSVEQIACRVGVADAHYFHAVYRQHFGETPKRGRGTGAGK